MGLFKDFKENRKSENLGNINPVMKGKYRLSNLQEIFTEYITKALIEGMENFDRKIKGFAKDDAILAAIETRTSSPIRINRGDNGESNIKGIFPCGEGAGYAGGIMSAAMDGIKIAEFIESAYDNK